MGAGGSIPADEAAAKEAGKTDDEIAIYKFCVDLHQCMNTLAAARLRR